MKRKIHPARYPAELPRFFINFLTEPDDLVLDPFAGSNTTGYVAESLNRRWVSMEINADYVEDSRLRFSVPEAEPPIPEEPIGNRQLELTEAPRDSAAEPFIVSDKPRKRKRR
jgi:DNA modification methylase